MLKPTIDNTSTLQTTKFMVSFLRMPHVVYYCQSANLPGVNLNEVYRYTPFVDLKMPGEKLVYDTFNITFLLDEEMKAWEEIHNWMRGLTFPERFEEYKQLKSVKPPFGGIYSDATLTINNNANNPKMRILLKDVFPLSLSPVLFDSTIDGQQTPVGEATFSVSYHQFQRTSS